jgi:hypothetical protein
MSARDINSCLDVHAKVSSLSTMPDLNLFKEKKKNQISAWSSFCLQGAPWTVFKNSAEMSSSHAWGSLYERLSLQILGAILWLFFQGAYERKKRCYSMWHSLQGWVSLLRTPWSCWRALLDFNTNNQYFQHCLVNVFWNQWTGCVSQIFITVTKYLKQSI